MEQLYTEQLYLSKKERIGILILLLILVLSTIGPYLWSSHKKEIQNKASLPEIKNDTPKEIIKSTDLTKSIKKFTKAETSALSIFDPNKLDLPTALKLGISKKTFTTLEKFRSKGAKFRKPEDFKKVYGISPKLFEKLLPFIVIESSKKVEKTEDNKKIDTLKKESSLPKSYSFKKNVSNIEINSASQEEWEDLPGIGYKLAQRIIKFKDVLGGFHSIMQIREVYGITDSCFNLIKIYLDCNSTIRKIQVNHSDEDELDAHPYINPKQAKFLVEYRRQHGAISDLEVLRNCKLFTEENLVKLAIYLDFTP